MPLKQLDVTLFEVKEIKWVTFGTHLTHKKININLTLMEG